MKPFQLIYASTASEKMTLETVRSMAAESHKNNLGKDITGLLLYFRGYFIQVLEGEQEHINALYLKISGDSRHRDLRILNYCQIAYKNFNDWAMRCVIYKPGHKASEIIDEYFPGSDPYDISLERANFFIHDIKRELVEL